MNIDDSSNVIYDLRDLYDSVDKKDPKRKLAKFNPYHGKDGKFSTGSGCIGVNGRDVTSQIEGDVATNIVYNKSGYPVKEDVMMREICKLQGFDGKPEVLEEKAFDQRVKDLGENALVLYRGVNSEKAVEQFKTGEYFSGQGVFGAGIYTSDKWMVAYEYSHSQGSSSQEAQKRIITMVVDKRTFLMIDRVKAGTLGTDLYNKTNKEVEDAKRKTGDFMSKEAIDKGHKLNIVSDIGRPMAMLGYDGMKIEYKNALPWTNSPPPDIYVIYNRTKVTVKK